MLKNVYFALCMVLAGSLLCAVNLVGSEGATAQSLPQDQHLASGDCINLIAEYCCPPTPELNLTVENPIPMTPIPGSTNLMLDHPTDSYFELLFKKDTAYNDFSLHALVRGRSYIPYFWVNYNKNPETGVYEKSSSDHDMLTPQAYSVFRRMKDEEFEEEIKRLNAKEIAAGDLCYNDAEKTTHGITSRCTFTPTNNNKDLTIKLHHDTRPLASAIDKATNRVLTRPFVAPAPNSIENHASKGHAIKKAPKQDNSLRHFIMGATFVAGAAKLYSWNKSRPANK